jgi:hypothetical protein
MEANNYTLLREFKSLKGKYTMQAYCYDPCCTYELHHRTNGSVSGVQSGIKTASELNKIIAFQLESYSNDGIKLIEASK